MTAATHRITRVVDSISPTKAERWFVFVVLLGTVFIPGLATKYNLLSQSAIQVFWSVAYVIAARQLFQMRALVMPIVRRCTALWILLALMFASTLWSVGPSTTIVDSIQLIGTTLIGLYIATRFSLTEFLRIVAIVFAAIGCVSLLLVFANPGWGRADWGSGPWQGIYDDKNLLGAGVSLAIISQVVLFPTLKGRGRWFLGAGMLLSGILLIGANSATAFANCGAVVLAALIAWACRSPKFGKFAIFGTVLTLAIGAAAVVIFGLTPDTVFSALGRESNLTGRADFWPYLQQAISDRPVLGFGFDAFFQSSVGVDYLSDYVVQAGGWSPYHAHNSYLQTLLDAGYVGLAALVTLLVVSFVRSIGYFIRERTSIGTWPLAIILFLTCTSFTETYYLDYNTLEWILFVAAIVYPLRAIR
jgi:exopolysaccharide production protein ExoQ